MKTRIALTIIGIIMILQSILYPLLADEAIAMMFNVGEEAQQVLKLFQIAVAPLFFMVGLIMLLLRKAQLATARTLLLAFIIGYIPTFVGFYFLAASPLTNAGIADFIPDFLMFGVALLAYTRPKS